MNGEKGKVATFPNSQTFRGWGLGNFENESQVLASALAGWIGDDIISKRESRRERWDLHGGNQGREKIT